MKLTLLALSLLAGAPLVASARKQCVVPAHKSCGGKRSSKSDSPAIARAFAECSENAEIVFPLGTEYNVFEPIEATNLSNVRISMAGNLNLPQDIPKVQDLVKSKGDSLTWFKLGGEDIEWVGTPNITTGWIKSYGQAWWDLNEPGKSGTPHRPHLFSLKAENAHFRWWKSLKPIAHNFKVHGRNITIQDSIVDAYSNSTQFPFNTDGFDVGASDVLIERSTVYNGDDAIAINDGAHNVVFRHAAIGYQTHGMSVGSLGSDPDAVVDVADIVFEDVTVAGGLYAARFKSWRGGQGLAQNITWQDIRTYNVSFPIFVTQTYYDQNKGDGSDRSADQAVTMKDFAWRDFSGTINEYSPGDGSCASEPCWYLNGLPSNLNHTEVVILSCATDESCQNFAVDQVQLYTQSGSPATQLCTGASAKMNPDLGIVCENGPYVPV